MLALKEYARVKVESLPNDVLAETTLYIGATGVVQRFSASGLAIIEWDDYKLRAAEGQTPMPTDDLRVLESPNDTWLRQGLTVYKLQDIIDGRGRTFKCNRLSASVQGAMGTPPEELNQAATLFAAAEDMKKLLAKYVDHDDVIEGMEGNEYWVNLKHEAQALLKVLGVDNIAEYVNKLDGVEFT